MTSHEGAFLDTPDRVVCIVGAGPAGLVLAHLLHQAGVSFVVLERLAAGELRFRTRAGLIENRTVELLKAYGLASPILERGSTNGVVEFRADGHQLVLDYGEITNSCGHYVYPQHELVGDWADELAAAGGNIRFGTRVTDMAQDDRGATGPRASTRTAASRSRLLRDRRRLRRRGGWAGVLLALPSVGNNSTRFAGSR